MQAAQNVFQRVTNVNLLSLSVQLEGYRLQLTVILVRPIGAVRNGYNH